MAWTGTICKARPWLARGHFCSHGGSQLSLQHQLFHRRRGKALHPCNILWKASARKPDGRLSMGASKVWEFFSFYAELPIISKGPPSHGIACQAPGLLCLHFVLQKSKTACQDQLFVVVGFFAGNVIAICQHESTQAEHARLLCIYVVLGDLM